MRAAMASTARAMLAISRPTAGATAVSCSLMMRRISPVDRLSMSFEAGFTCSVSSFSSTSLFDPSANTRRAPNGDGRRRSAKSHRVGLGVERTAAPARALHVGVVELEAGAFHGLDVIDFGAIQIQHAGLIDEHLEPVIGVGFVQHVRRIFEGHRIAEAGAAAAHDGNAQARRLRVLGRQDFLHLVHCLFSQTNHKSLVASIPQLPLSLATPVTRKPSRLEASAGGFPATDANRSRSYRC